MDWRPGMIMPRKRWRRIARVVGLATIPALAFALQIAPYLLSRGR